MKKALVYAEALLFNLKDTKLDQLELIFNYIKPGFAQVQGDFEIKQLKDLKSNAMFKEYDRALKVAQLILKKYGYNISKTSEKEISTPPFWIDMTKLFELYVFKKLKDIFPKNGEVQYHKKVYHQEPDFILNSNDGKYKMVIDAKYKPKYDDGEIVKEDARQVSGYARLIQMYKELKITDYSRVIDALIIYSSQNRQMKLTEDRLTEDKSEVYVGFFKVGVSLPEL